MDAVRNLQRRYELRAVAYDPRLFDKAAEELAGEGAPMVQFDQTNARMCPASAELRRAILSDELRHYGDPTLSAHVAAGVMKDVWPDQWRLTKVRRRGAPIDALIALAMAHDLYVKGTNLKPDPAAWRIELV